MKVNKKVEIMYEVLRSRAMDMDKYPRTFNIVDENDPTRIFFFMKADVGNAVYIYYMYDYDSKYTSSVKYDAKNFHDGIEAKPNVAAILVKNTLYVIDKFIFGAYSHAYGHGETAELEDFICIDEYLKEINNTVNDTIVKNFYDSLEVETPANTKPYEEDVRRKIFNHNNVEDVSFSDCLDLKDIVESLCGFIDIEDTVNKRLESRRENYLHLKTQKETIKKLIPDLSIAAKWERDLADALNSVDAKKVTVEFLFKGKKASGKIAPECIIRKLIKKDYFSDYNFSTRVAGQKLFDELGVSTKMWDNENQLKCEHISKITYGKKVLYERKGDASEVQ